MKTTRFITSALAAVMLVSGGALPAAAENAPAMESAAISVIGGLATPKITKATKSSSKVKLKWNKVKGANGYQIFKKTSKGWKRVKSVSGGSATTCTVKGLNSHTKYRFKIRAFRKCCGKITFSKYSAAKIATTKYGFGKSNYTEENYEIGTINSNWEHSYTKRGGHYDIVQLTRITDDDKSRASVMSFCAEKLNKERWEMTLDDFVEFEIGEWESLYDPVYYKLNGYRTIDGVKCAVLKEDISKNASYIVLALKGHELYHIEYFYPSAKKDSYGKEVEKMLTSLKFTPQS